MDCGVYALCAAETHLTALRLAVQQLSGEGEASTSTSTKSNTASPMTNTIFTEAKGKALSLLASPFLAEGLTPEAVAAKRSELLSRAIAL